MDKLKIKLSSFAIIAAVTGFMIAIQFQTVKDPVERDTRDIWQLREALLKEKELQSKLLIETRATEEKLADYETKRQQGKEQVLRDTLEELKVESGLSEISGPGIVLTVEPVFEEGIIGEPMNSSISPDLLKRLLNELNMYEAAHISIDGQRIINTSVIREISAETKVDGHTLNGLPLEIKVVTKDMRTAEKLFNRMKVSNSAEEFFLENLRLSVSDPMDLVAVEAYENKIRIHNMEPVKEGGDR